MEFYALILVLIGSILHLGWNILTKGAKDKLAFLWLALVFPSFGGIYFLYTYFNHSSFSSIGALCILVSAIIHSFYFCSLSNAYRVSDLSYVYPYSRSIGALLSIIGGILFLKESPSNIGYVGIILTLIATFIEPLSQVKRKVLNSNAVILTISTGIAIAGYLLVDQVGMKYVSVLTYLSGLLLGAMILLTPMVLVSGRIKRELRESIIKPLLGSLFLCSAYGVVLAAMKITPVSYIVSARASGIIVSGIGGILFFKEKVTYIRWLAIGLTTIGIYFIGIA